MRTHWRSSSPSMRVGLGPPASWSCFSTSSVIDQTWRSLLPLAITNHSHSASTSPTSRTTTSEACLASAARAATTAQSRGSSRVVARGSWVRARSSQVGSQHDRYIERVDRSNVLDHLAGAEGLLEPLGGPPVLGPVVADLGG